MFNYSFMFLTLQDSIEEGVEINRCKKGDYFGGKLVEIHICKKGDYFGGKN